jgi:hypothetical protein
VLQRKCFPSFGVSGLVDEAEAALTYGTLHLDQVLLDLDLFSN